ncbi:TerB family tellurite resistance protein [Lutibacter citreus]|uniref:TerB family tellurite resistance protein n=1 Tax=Lutibacter citreus TaxID=2138210 RepID=UPI000DBE9C52|nr:TerB family tellurite resistance protein [Lutibacter citreus]
MSISDLYPTGLHEQNTGHFGTIVRLALRDDKIDENEYVLLKRLARRLDISKSEFKSILKNPDKYPANPPVSYNERLERLYDLTKMLFLDRNPTIDKTSLMDRIAIELGFPVENVRLIVKESIKFFLKEPDLEDFKAEIKKVNLIKH